MNRSLKNISPKIFREYLVYKGLKKIRNKGGHEIWSRSDLNRPVVFQTHIDPIPEFIVKNNLRTIGTNAKDFFTFLEND
jgi:hypothetical protein